MDWATFESLPEDKLRRENAEKKARLNRHAIIIDVVKRNNFTPLESPYLDMSSFYFDSSTSFIWQVQNISNVVEPVTFYKPSYDIYQTIRKQNKITLDRYNTQSTYFMI